MVRKIKDYYFKKAQKENYPARSIFKLEEAQKKYRLLKRGDKVLDIACHPGSWSIYAAGVVGPSGLVVGVDLQEGDRIARANSAKIHRLRGDITDPEIVETIREVWPVFDVVISDIAPSTTGNKWVDQQHSLRLARRTLELAGHLLVSGGNYYGKVFEGEDFPEFVREVKQCFKTVKTVKPQSSRKESREVFVLGLGYLGSSAG